MIAPHGGRPLTDRQEEVARLVARGYSRREIATALGCSVETVRAHLRAIGQRIPGTAQLRRRICEWVETKRAA